jgi:hypothetical protein
MYRGKMNGHRAKRDHRQNPDARLSEFHRLMIVERRTISSDLRRAARAIILALVD